ncbi:hypothetical protein BH23ACT10_BH23ACT10_06200 [soil metagenome]
MQHVRMRSALERRGLALGCAAAGLLTVARDLRRARRVTRLGPPAPTIDARIAPPNRGSAAPASSLPPIQLVALGDSSIAGVGASQLSACLAVQIAQRVATGCDRAVHIRGYGVSGARTADVARQAQDLDPAVPPDAIVIVVGANDVAHVTSPWRYVRTVASVHRGLRERFDAPVIVCSLPEFRAMTVVGAPLRTLAIVYGRLLGVFQRLTVRRIPGVHWVNGRALAGPAFRRLPHAMAADGYHPSDLGYTLPADTLAPAVVRVVNAARV